MPVRPSLRADAALLVVAFMWGATFPVVKGALVDASPLLYLVLRFALASLLLLPMASALRGRWGARELSGGILLGALLALGFALQTVGLASTTPSRSAFLTSLYVIFVPLLSVALTGHRPRSSSWLGALAALGGLGLMTWQGGLLRWQPGDLLTLACALAFALHILGVGVLAGRYDFRRMFVIQILTAMVMLTLMLPLESIHFNPSLRLLLAVVATGVLATHLALYIQNRAQRRTSASRAAIIFAMEPVFAALVTAMLASGRSDLTLIQGCGGVLIVIGLVIAGLGSRGEGTTSP